MAIYIFLVSGFASWDNCNMTIGNLANLIPKFDKNFKNQNAELVLMSIRYLRKFYDLKLKNSITYTIQLFDLIWYKNVELKFKFGSDHWIRFL